MRRAGEPADPELVAAYRHSRQLNARHGKTFFLATALLPRHKRPAIHALYGFARYADDLIDQPLPGSNPAAELATLGASLLSRIADGPEACSPPVDDVVIAAADTVRRYGIDPRYIADFLNSMASDLTVTRYADSDALHRYMWGSAAVIGLQVLPVLGVCGDRALAEAGAAELGIAFQLTNFLRDVGEDYRRGRIYLPQDRLAAHGVTEPMLAEQHAGPPLRALIAEQVAVTRGHYRRAAPAIAQLDPDARDCVRVASVLYGEILDEIERADHDVLARRATVGTRRRAVVGFSGLVRAVTARARPSRPTYSG